MIVSKRGAKYEVDKDKWTNYGNVCDMRDHVYDELIDAQVASEYESLMWQNGDGCACNEDGAFGCKVTHNLTHTNMCVVMDIKRGKISQTRKRQIRGELLVFGK